MTPTDRSDRTVVRYDPVMGPPRRVVYEPATEGFVRSEQVWTGCRWRQTGSEHVANLHVDSASP